MLFLNRELEPLRKIIFFFKKNSDFIFKILRQNITQDCKKTLCSENKVRFLRKIYELRI